jgi:hypothetical protein
MLLGAPEKRTLQACTVEEEALKIRPFKHNPDPCSTASMVENGFARNGGTNATERLRKGILIKKVFCILTLSLYRCAGPSGTWVISGVNPTKL